MLSSIQPSGSSRADVRPPAASTTHVLADMPSSVSARISAKVAWPQPLISAVGVKNLARTNPVVVTSERATNAVVAAPRRRAMACASTTSTGSRVSTTPAVLPPEGMDAKQVYNPTIASAVLSARALSAFLPPLSSDRTRQLSDSSLVSGDCLILEQTC